MKIVLIVLILSLIALSFFIYLRNKPVKIIPLTEMLDEEVRKYRRNIPASIAIGVYKDGKIIFRNYGNDISEKSIFQIGSITKLLTASSFQILVEQKKYSYSTTVGEILNDIPVDSGITTISLLDLATHTSGIPSIPKPLMEYVEKAAGKDNVSINPYSYLDEKMVFDYLNNPVDLSNKKTFSYSNFGMGLLGILLTKKNHSSYEDVVNSILLTPLDMTDTFIQKQDINKLIQGYTADGKVNPPWEFGALEAAGAFNSNTQDMMKFIAANLDEKSPLFSILVKTHNPQKDGETGIGWLQPNAIDKLARNTSMQWHNGMVGGFASYIAIDKHHQTGLIFLSNHAIDTTMVGSMIMRRLKNVEFPE